MINSTAGTFNTPILIAEKDAFTNGSRDSIPQLSVVNGEVVSAAIEIKSTTGGLLISRMTTAERNLMNVDNGMMIYNLDEGAFDIYANGSWKVITGGAVLPTVVDNIAVFSDTNGTIQDSGVAIGPRLPFTSSSVLSPDSDLQISNLGYVQFTGKAGYVFLGLQAAVQMFEQPAPQNICTLFTDGGIPSGPSSPSAAVEINTPHGALILSRMLSISDMEKLTGEDGMILYNEATAGPAAPFNNFHGYVNGAWQRFYTTAYTPENPDYGLRVQGSITQSIPPTTTPNYSPNARDLVQKFNWLQTAGNLVETLIDFPPIFTPGPGAFVRQVVTFTMMVSAPFSSVVGIVVTGRAQVHVNSSGVMSFVGNPPPSSDNPLTFVNNIGGPGIPISWVINTDNPTQNRLQLIYNGIGNLTGYIFSYSWQQFGA